MTKLKGVVSHHEREVAELRADRELAVEYLKAAMAALDIPRDRCRDFAARHSMRDSARGFLDNVAAAIGLRANAFQAAG